MHHFDHCGNEVYARPCYGNKPTTDSQWLNTRRVISHSCKVWCMWGCWSSSGNFTIQRVCGLLGFCGQGRESWRVSGWSRGEHLPLSPRHWPDPSYSYMVPVNRKGIHMVYCKDYSVRIVSLPQSQTEITQSDNGLCLYGYRGNRSSRGSFINMRSPTNDMSWDNHNNNYDVLKSYWISDTIPNSTLAFSHWIFTNAFMVGTAVITSIVQVRKLWQEMVNDLPKVTWCISGKPFLNPGCLAL